MRSRRSRTGALLLAISTLPSCVGAEEPERDDPPYEELVAQATALDERPCPEDSIVTYENFGASLVLSWCNGCHSAALPVGERGLAPVGVDFDDIERIREHADRIWARAADHNATMPPVGELDDDDRTLLGEWLACGAPANADLE